MVGHFVKIGLLDHMGGGNLGDDATLDSARENISSRWPNAEIYAFCMNPGYASARHHMRAYPLRVKTWDFTAGGREQSAADGAGGASRGRNKTAVTRYVTAFVRAGYRISIRIPQAVLQECLFLARSLRILKSFDLLVINGGGQLTDSWGGPWKFPYTVFKWVWMARLSGVRRIVLNVGAGPLKQSLSRWFVKSSLAHAEYVSFRDEKSRALVRGIGFQGRTLVAPDTVYGLAVASSPRPESATGGDSIVGIAPMAYGDLETYPEHDPSVHDRCLRVLAQFGSWLVANRHRLRLTCSDIGVDPPAVRDLEARLRTEVKEAQDGSIGTPSVNSIGDLLSVMLDMTCIVTSRFHGVVFAHILNIPVIAISHHPKIDALMADMDMSDYCIDITALNLDWLKAAFTGLAAQRDTIKARMAAKAENYRKELSLQFDQLFPAVRPSGSEASLPESIVGEKPEFRPLSRYSHKG